MVAFGVSLVSYIDVTSLYMLGRVGSAGVQCTLCRRAVFVTNVGASCGLSVHDSVPQRLRDPYNTIVEHHDAVQPPQACLTVKRNLSTSFGLGVSNMQRLMCTNGHNRLHRSL
jgi:hypothetical protein